MTGPQSAPPAPARVSVVVPHYGSDASASEMTAALVRRLRGQRGVDCQLIVVDDASPVPLGEVDGAQVVRRESNGGFGSAVNTGARLADREWLAILNSDIEIDDDFLATLVEQARPWQPALVAPAVHTTGHSSYTARRWPRARFQMVERLGILARWHDRRWWNVAAGQDLRAVPGTERPVDWLAGVVMLLPRRSFVEVGGFDERYFMYAEEVDLQRRLAAIGVPAVYLGRVSAQHRGAASSDPGRREDWLVRSRLTYADKWGGRRRLRAGLTAAALVNLGVDSVRRATGRPVRPLADARRLLTRVWQPIDRQPLHRSVPAEPGQRPR